jgi:hypothetical protein
LAGVANGANSSLRSLGIERRSYAWGQVDPV